MKKKLTGGIDKQISFDSDLWVLEVEAKDGRGLLDQDYLKGKLNGTSGLEMKWNDEGILIGTKFHGEKNCIIKVLRKIMVYIQG